MLRSLFPPYQISHRTAETLKANEPARWAAAEDDLAAGAKKLSRKQAFTEDQAERLVGLALLVELGVIKRTFPDKPPVAEPVAVAVGEPVAPEPDPEPDPVVAEVHSIEGWP